MVSPPFGRIGGKTRLKKRIVKLFPKDYENMIYVEPFIGAGSIFYYKNPSKKEVINDLEDYVVRLHQGLKKYDGYNISDDFKKMLVRWNKNKYEKLKNSNPKNEYNKFLKDYLLTRTSFFSKTTNQSFGQNKNKIPKIDLKHKYNERLKDTIILNDDFKNVVKKYDSKNTFFYLDPPYENSKNLYENETLPIKDVYDVLKKIKGKFLLSYNDSDEAKNLFKDFNIKYIYTTYANPIKGGSDRIKKEMNITNY